MTVNVDVRCFHLVLISFVRSGMRRRSGRVLHSSWQVLVVASVPYMMPFGRDITAAGFQGGIDPNW
jgi:hypothetical protein